MEVKEESEKADLKFNIQKPKIMTSGSITSWEIDGEKWKQWQILSSWAPKSLQMVTGATIWKDICFLEENNMTNINSVLKSRHCFANKSPSSQGYGFSSSHVWMWELDYVRKLSTEELMLLNCDVGEDSWESLGLQEDPTSPF